MTIHKQDWEILSSYFRTKLISLLEKTLFQEENNKKIETPHEGLYISIIDNENNEISKEGFLKEKQTDVFNSLKIVLNSTYSVLSAKNIPAHQVKSSTVIYSLITGHQYIHDPLSWDENADGVHFMWGQQYKGFLLPYEIKRMGVNKIEVMDRLCSFNVKVASNLWKLPEGMVTRLFVDTYTT